MTDKIAVDRDFLEHAVVALEYAYSADDEMAMESIKYLRAALAGPPSMQPLPNHDNHHNALKCPYCNPRGLVFAEPAAQPLQNCFDALETVTKHFTRTPSTLRDSQVRGMAHAAMKECHAAMTEAALQKISDFGQDQAMTPDVLISKLANLRAIATERHVPEVDLATIDLAIEHLRYFSATPLQRLNDERMDGIYNAWRDMGDDVSYGDLMRMVEAEIQGGK
jgi:hypothetical protein